MAQCPLHLHLFQWQFCCQGSAGRGSSWQPYPLKEHKKYNFCCWHHTLSLEAWLYSKPGQTNKSMFVFDLKKPAFDDITGKPNGVRTIQALQHILSPKKSGLMSTCQSQEETWFGALVSERGKTQRSNNTRLGI